MVRGRTIERIDVAAAACVAAAVAAVTAALVAGGLPTWPALAVGAVGFAAASRARVEQPGGLKVTMDMQEAAIVGAALLLTFPEVIVVAVAGNALAQLRRHDDVRVAAVSWVLPLAGIAMATAAVDALASPSPGPSWVLAGLVGSLAHALGSWAMVRLTLTYVHGRRASEHARRDLLAAATLGVPVGQAGVLVACAAQVGWWAWVPVAGLGGAALAGSAVANEVRLRVQHHGVLTHLRALADVSVEDAPFLERAKEAMADAIGGQRITIEHDPPTDADARTSVRAGVHLCATRALGSAPLRPIDRRFLADAAEIVGAALDTFDERRALQRVATTDPLTGLGNRRLVEEAVRAGTAAPWGVVLIDIDNLKAVNDTLGHQAGDALLREAATILRSAIRSGDVAARTGGDEFVVLTSDPDSIPTVEDRLRELFGSLSVPPELHAGACIGAAVAPRDGTTLDELLEVADLRMYDRKRNVRRPAVHSRSPLANAAGPEGDHRSRT